jgi:hypothetical protein
VNLANLVNLANVAKVEQTVLYVQDMCFLYTLPNMLKLPSSPICCDLLLAKLARFAKALFEKKSIERV